MGGGLLDLLQYYMGGDYNLKVIVQRTVTMSMYWNFTCFFATTHFVANYVEFCKKNAILRSLPNLLQYDIG